MKKLIALVLVLVLVLSMTGCTSETDKTLERAREMMETGDYDGARKAITSDASYLQFSAMLEEIRRQDLAFLLGRWVTLDGTVRYDFDDRGMVTIHYEYGEPEQLRYFYENGRLEIYSLYYDLTEKDGILYLGDPAQSGALVREKDWDSVAETIPITMDNWEDYFEYRELQRVPDVAEDGTIRYIWLQNAFVLRDAYVDPFLYSSVEFDVKNDGGAWYDTDWRPNREGNLDFSMTGYYETDEEGGAGSCGVIDRRMSGYESELSDLYGLICADYYVGEVDGSGGVWLKRNPAMTNVSGSLVLRK